MTYAPCDPAAGQAGTPEVGTCSITTSQRCVYDRDCPQGSCSITTGLVCRSDTDCPTGELCQNAEICRSGQWISAINYERIFHILSRESGLEDAQALSPVEGGQREYLVATGIINTADEVESRKFSRLFLPVGTDDEPGNGSYSLELQSQAGNLLFVRYFELGGENPAEGSGQFAEAVPYDPDTVQIILKHGNQVIETIPVSSNIPVVTVTFPNGGESLSGEATINWTASDADGDALVFDVLYSRDNGKTWSALAVNLDYNSFGWNTNEAPGTDQGLIRILASDGVNSGQDDSDAPFEVIAKSPDAVILSPEADADFFINEMIIFEARGYDLEDGPLEDNSFSWASNIDGDIGAGRILSLSDLSIGEHVITLQVKDSDQNEATVQVPIRISSSQDSDGDRVGNDSDNCSSIYNPDQSDIDGDGAGDNCDHECEGDLDLDIDVDQLDLALFALEIGRADCNGAPACKADSDGDGDVDSINLLMAIQDFGRIDCPSSKNGCKGDLVYDTGVPGWHWSVNKNYGIAVRFTPPVYPWTFDLAKFWPWSDTGTRDIEVHIWDDDGPAGLPGRDLITPFIHRAEGTGHWESVNLPVVTINTGEFYIGWIQKTADPFLYYNGSDDAESSNGRSYVRYPDGSWKNFLSIGQNDNIMIQQGCQNKK